VARMSIDDMILRDPRVLRLAALCGIGRHDAIGRLLAVFAITYDRVSDVIDCADVDIAAEVECFAEHMITVNLGVRVREGVRIRGAKKRIKYLNDLAGAASEAGRKSGESRRKKANEKRTAPFTSGTATVQKSNGATNPVSPDTVPDPSPSAPTAPPPEREIKAPRSEILAGQFAGFDAAEPGHRSALAEWAWREIGRRRLGLAKEFGIPAPLPLAPITPASHPPSFRELLARVREEGATAADACVHVLEAATVHARKERSVEWIGEKLCTEGGWRWARGQVPTWRGPAKADSAPAAESRRYGIIDGERVEL